MLETSALSSPALFKLAEPHSHMCINFSNFLHVQSKTGEKKDLAVVIQLQYLLEIGFCEYIPCTLLVSPMPNKGELTVYSFELITVQSH